MTLIVSFNLPNAILVKSDGRTSWHGKKLHDNVQKIFPIVGSSYAIAHSGLNKFFDAPYEVHLKQMGLAAFKTPAQIAARISDYLLDRLPIGWCDCANCSAAKQGCTFVIHGFDHRKRPRRVEVTWNYNTAFPRVIDHSEPWGYAHGSGWEQVRWPTRPDPDPQKAKVTLDEVFADALSRAGESCGGDLHTLKISPDGWEWRDPPTNTPKMLESHQPRAVKLQPSPLSTAVTNALRNMNAPKKPF